MFKSLIKSGYGLKAVLPDLSSQCAVCRSWPSRPVCAACISRFSLVAPRCRACAIELSADLSGGLRTSHGLCAGCLREHPPVEGTLVAATYAYPWSDLITGYKFRDKPGWAPFFADLLLANEAIRGNLRGLDAQDLVLPMPLSAERLQERGFNQAWELTVNLLRKSGSVAQAEARLLLRVRHTRPQTELRRDARMANVRGAFQLDPLRAGMVSGKRVVLVDDVMTSGASLFTAARVLRDAGAASVTALAIARTAAA